MYLLNFAQSPFAGHTTNLNIHNINMYNIALKMYNKLIILQILL